MNPQEDGITHINVYSKGKTELGRFLTNFAHAPFVHPEDGFFKSVEAYWYWLSTKDDSLRETYGFRAKELGRQLGGKDWLEDENLKTKIKDAIFLKIFSNKKMLAEFKNSSLPFAHYYVYGGVKVVEPKEGKWIIDFIEGLRNEHS